MRRRSGPRALVRLVVDIGERDLEVLDALAHQGDKRCDYGSAAADRGKQIFDAE
jgi:hypothetical protein